MTPVLQSEYLVRALETVLAAQIRTHLDAVEALWVAAGDPLDLPSPAAITRGFNEGLLKLGSEDFPRISILGAPLTPVSNTDQHRFAEAIHTIVLEWHVLAPTSRDAVTRMWRYGQAIMGLLWEAQSFAGFHPVGLVPTISEGQPMPHVGPVGRKPEGLYIAGSIATWPFRGRYARP